MKIIKTNIYEISWEDFENKLYKVVISEEDLLLQFDEKRNLRRIDGNPIREKCYILFLDYLRSLQNPTDRQNILKFICGNISIPLPTYQKIQVNLIYNYFINKYKLV